MRGIILCLAATLLLIFACAEPPKKKPRIARKNRLYRCTPAEVIQKNMLDLVNQARRAKRRCGGSSYAPAQPVRWNRDLAEAALKQSDYMAASNRLSHKGSGGTTVEKRVRRTGYVWRSVGENVAGGMRSCEEVVTGWLSSPAHCANIMEDSFTEIGAACARNADARYGTYWTLVLASPLR
jgi:uncharacterized protein YkwD